jgi:hypothetical protein
MVLRAYPLLQTQSRRAISRKYGRFGRLAEYSPRDTLLSRISKILGISKSAAYSLLMQEREYLLKNQK